MAAPSACRGICAFPLRPFRSLFDPAQDHADVLSAAAHDRMEHVALGPLERAARQTAVALHVPDHRLDGRPAPDVPAQRRGHALPLSRNEDLGSLHAMAAAAPVGEGAPGPDAGHLLSLPERLGKRVAVMGSAQEGHGADDGTREYVTSVWEIFEGASVEYLSCVARGRRSPWRMVRRSIRRGGFSSGCSLCPARKSR